MMMKETKDLIDEIDRFIESSSSSSYSSSSSSFSSASSVDQIELLGRCLSHIRSLSDQLVDARNESYRNNLAARAQNAKLMAMTSQPGGIERLAEVLEEAKSLTDGKDASQIPSKPGSPRP
jgi:hypothetical protein